jgi:Pao retrotransposon peptidase.
LNDRLLTGPSLQNDIFDVLTRFREGSVAVTADIEAMFSRIGLQEDDTRYHRFLWRNEDADPPETYQMTGVVFGDSPSPCLAIHTLFQTAEDSKCSNETKRRVQTQFYVDDYLDSFASSETALQECLEVKRVLAEGNFNLTGWISSCPTLAQELGGEVTKNKALLEKASENKVLGMKWNTREDTLVFEVAVENIERLTRRSVLSRLAGLYDPLGLLAPIVVAGKIKMKELVVRGQDWDDDIPSVQSNWWRNSGSII